MKVINRICNAIYNQNDKLKNEYNIELENQIKYLNKILGEIMK